MNSQGRVMIKHDAMINGPTEIAQQAYNDILVIAGRLMHKLRQFIHRISNV